MLSVRVLPFRNPSSLFLPLHVVYVADSRVKIMLQNVLLGADSKVIPNKTLYIVEVTFREDFDVFTSHRERSSLI